jgi:hypothetical protein
MLEKTPRSGKDVDVTFRFPPTDGVVELYLCGDFNNWHKSGAPLRQEADGSWVVTLTLETGKSYRFRYYDNQSRWHNDWEADAYVPNEFGTEDSVVDLAAPLKNVLPEAQQISGRRRPARTGTGAKPHPQAKPGRGRHASGGPRGGQPGGHSTGGNRPGGHGGHGGNRPHHRPGEGKNRGR